jgi:hypothetical protein
MPVSRCSFLEKSTRAKFHWQFPLENFMEGTNFGYKRVWNGISDIFQGIDQV